MQHEPVSALEEAPKITRVIVVSENAMARAGIAQAINMQLVVVTPSAQSRTKFGLVF